MRRLLLAAAAVIGIAAPALADEAPRWGQVGNWWLGVDPSFGNGCFMATGYRDGTGLRIGFVNALDGKPYDGSVVIVANAAWKSLELGKIYQVDLQLDNASAIPFKARAISIGDIVALRIGFDASKEVIASFAVAGSLKLSYSGRLLTALPLTGSSAAAKELFTCNQQFTSNGNGDPFAVGQATPRSRPVVHDDPFAPSY